MTDSAARLADEVLPQKPLRQWVLSLPFALRFLLATDAEALTQVLGIVYCTISHYVLKKARLARTSGANGALTLIQRFGSALNPPREAELQARASRDWDAAFDFGTARSPQRPAMRSS